MDLPPRPYIALTVGLLGTAIGQSSLAFAIAKASISITMDS